MSEAEGRLREALQARADAVELSADALPRIRMRTRRRGLWRGLALLAATAAAAITAAAVVAAPGTDRRQDVPPSTETSGNGANGEVGLPVYFARNGRLYREFHRVRLEPDTDQARIRAAVELSLAGAADDPDYRSLWPAATAVEAVTIAGAQVTVELSAPPPSAAAAVQQLVYTVAAASTYTSIKHADGVRLRSGATDTGVLRQAPPADVQAPVWVIDPAEGAQVGKAFTVYLAGVVPEGAVHLRVLDAAGRTAVGEQLVQLSAGAPRLGEARVALTLPSGRYRVEAWFVSVQDGSMQWVDDHDFRIG